LLITCEDTTRFIYSLPDISKKML